MDLGNLQASRPLMEQTCEQWRRVSGPDDTDTLTAVYNLGMLHWHIAHGQFLLLSFSAVEDGHVGPCDVANCNINPNFLLEFSIENAEMQ